MSRPKSLELYGCEGGSAKGYADAGLDPYVIDLFDEHSQARCPFPSFKGDAILALVRLLAGEALPFTHPATGAVEWLTLADFVMAHASPPCQDASAGTRALRKQGAKSYPKLIEPTRWLLRRTGLPYVIENVRGAALVDPITLCGCMFDLTAVDVDGLPLRLERPRLFESNFTLTPPRPCWHDPAVWVAGSYGGSRRAKRRPGESLAEVAPRDRHEAKYVRKGGYVPRSLGVQQALLGIDWMTVKGMHQSLPPAYTQHVGRQLLEAIGRGEVDLCAKGAALVTD